MIRKLESMCYNLDFDEDEALSCIRNVDINQEFKATADTLSGITTTFLKSAIEGNNIRILELLLKNGANPDQIYNNGDNVLWDLQYAEDDKFDTRLQMTQILLEYGANPLITPENDGMSLFEYVTWAIFNDYDDYRCRFFILLVAYGAKCDYCTPRIAGTFDKSDIKQYRFKLVPAGDGYTGEIIDSDNNVIAYI